MGGTYANHMMLGYADALYYADQRRQSGDAAVLRDRKSQSVAGSDRRGCQ